MSAVIIIIIDKRITMKERKLWDRFMLLPLDSWHSRLSINSWSYNGNCMEQAEKQ